MLHRFLSEQEKAQAGTLSEAQTAELETPETADLRTAQAVNEWLAKVQKKARRSKRRYLTTFILVAMLVLPSYIYLQIHPTSQIASILMDVGGCGEVLWLLWAFLAEPDWNVDKLLQEGGVRAIGPLMELLNAATTPGRLLPVYAALTTLLPQLKASDANLLSNHQRANLCKLLQRNFGLYIRRSVYDDFRIAILKGLEQIGDVQALPIVEKLANRTPRTPRERRLQEVAAECFPLLRANSTAVGETQTLLRASTSEDQPEVLLRPVNEMPATDPQELLRANDFNQPDP